MSSETQAERPFEGEHAKAYDQRNDKLAPFRESILLLTQVACARARKRARILCVGVGTGEEVVYLARRNPGWRFMLVEPSRDMLDICRQKMEAQGFSLRCDFHEGYLESLTETPKFDAATCLLVAHFVLDKTERVRLYRQIADRLTPGGVLINADLSADKQNPSYRHMLTLWQRMWQHADYIGDDDQALDRMMEQFERKVALLPPSEVGDLLAEAGFRETASPVLQSLLIHTWVCFASARTS
jgi:tRNA (cmo5U34)-methyltransferase